MFKLALTISPSIAHWEPAGGMQAEEGLALDEEALLGSALRWVAANTAEMVDRHNNAVEKGQVWKAWATPQMGP